MARPYYGWWMVGAAVVPLPHPSGVSLWLNSAANRTLVEQSVKLIHAELGRV